MDERKFLVLTRSKQAEFKNTTKRVIDVRVLAGDKVSVTFEGSDPFTYNKKNVRFFHTPEIINIDDFVVIPKNAKNKKYNEALIFGNEYVVLFCGEYSDCYRLSDVHLIPDIARKHETQNLINYYKKIANYLEKTTPHIKWYFDEKLKKIRADSVISNFITGVSPKSNITPAAIFPFGVNTSQREAVQKALTSQISLIQGPPGTGKTQTILNIIANLVCQNKTVAVVSGNNEATLNVYEKLAKEGFGFITACLGKVDLQDAFFAQKHDIPEMEGWGLPDDVLSQTQKQIASTDKLIFDLLERQNTQARLQEQISKLEIEQRYFEQHFSVEPINPSVWSFGNKWKTPDLMKFMAEVEHLSTGGKLAWPLRFKWLFKFGIYTFKDIKSLSGNLFKGLVSEYYRRRKIELLESKYIIEQELKKHDLDGLLKQYTDCSLSVLKKSCFLNAP